MKYSLEESFQRLRNELNKFLKHSSTKEVVAHHRPHHHQNHQHVVDKPKTHFVDNWSETEVKDWFVKNNINVAILDHLSPCSGIVLKQVYDMKKTAPEFFYHSLEKSKGVNLSSLSVFTHFLLKLFEENE